MNTDKQRKNSDNISGNNESDKRGKHPNSMANLKPFPKGVSGNPLGRPTKYEKLKKALNELADKEPDIWDDTEGSRRKQVLVGIWRYAIKGDMKFVQLLAELGCLDGND